MKLLMISGDRSVLGGKRGAFHYTLDGFRAHWDRIDVLCPRPEKPGGDPHPFPNVFFHPSPRGLLRQSFWILRKGKELIAEHRHDVITVHEYPPFYNGIGALLLHRATGVPFALEIHHVVGWPFAASIAEWIGARLSPFFIRFEAGTAAAVRTVSGSVRAQLLSFDVPPERILLIPSFYIDRGMIGGVASPPVAYDVAFCARLVRSKGLLPVIAALRGLPEARLLVIGEGPERRRAQARVRVLGMEHRVTFTGWLTEQQDVLGALKSARIFVMNSTSEGGPRIALEAMACGMPVIATGVGVMPEVIRDGENGFLTTGSPADLARKISLLLRDETLRRRVGENARGVLGIFDRDMLLKGYADFLKGLVAHEPPSS